MNSTVSPAELRDIPLLAGLDDRELGEFVSHCETAICPPETVIVAQGAEERALIIVLDGAVQVRLTVPHVGETVVAEFSAQGAFGEVSFFHAGPHSATVFCVESARLLRLQYGKFEQLKSANNRLAFVLGVNAAELLARRIQHIDAWLTERLTQMQDDRIHQSWRSFRERVGRPTYVSGGFKV